MTGRTKTDLVLAAAASIAERQLPCARVGATSTHRAYERAGYRRPRSRGGSAEQQVGELRAPLVTRKS
jgi:hypothetical protein